jgi:hypothetical protein
MSTIRCLTRCGDGSDGATRTNRLSGGRSATSAVRVTEIGCSPHWSVIRRVKRCHSICFERPAFPSPDMSRSAPMPRPMTPHSPTISRADSAHAGLVGSCGMGQCLSLDLTSMVTDGQCHRVRSWALARLEPCDGKLSCTVLRGGSGRKVIPLPDARTAHSAVIRRLKWLEAPPNCKQILNTSVGRLTAAGSISFPQRLEYQFARHRCFQAVFGGQRWQKRQINGGLTSFYQVNFKRN